MTIKHLVIGGGDVYGFSFYGLLRETNRQNKWKMEDIKSIYGLSVGSIIGVMVALKLDWDILDDFLINCHWNKIFNFNLYDIITNLNTMGIFDIEAIKKIFTPLFSAVDLSIDMTMKDFYEYTNIEHHIFVSKMDTNTNTFETLNISHVNFPDWKLIDAIYMSCCLPKLFRPIIQDGFVYLDGIFTICNCIIDFCKEDINEILYAHLLVKRKSSPMTNGSSLYDLIIHIGMSKVVREPETPTDDETHEHFYTITPPDLNIERFYTIFNEKNKRIELIDLGVSTFTNKKWDKL